MKLFSKKEKNSENIVFKSEFEHTPSVDPILIVKLKEWIWVDGYKGTNENLKCNGYQFENGKTFVFDGDSVKLCKSGFHFCYKLSDVFNYYSIGTKNRFFRVEGLVDKEEYEETVSKYGKVYFDGSAINTYDSKLVAKEIRFIEEIYYDDLKEYIYATRKYIGVHKNNDN